jgi:hypothetical protein
MAHGRALGWSLGLAVLGGFAGPAAAQLEPFSFRFAPFCNVLTLTAAAQGDAFDVTGTDDQCGGSTQLGAVGTAFFNPDGTIGLSLTVVSRAGVAIGHTMKLDAVTLSGTWLDSQGNSGAFIFNPVTPTAGEPRPMPGGPFFNNTAVGAGALQKNTEGARNTAVGFQSLQDNTTANFNTAVGAGALQKNTEGARNTASGSSALGDNTTGNDNTASGSSALESNTTGNFNTASGNAALVDNTTGNDNTATGGDALGSNTTGAANTAIGRSALTSNTTGNFNTAIGLRADVSAPNLTNATAIGASAVVNASNKVRIGNAGVTVIEGNVPFTATSDKNQKEHFKPVDGEEVLNKIRQIPVQSWNYIRQNPSDFRHYGPVAQDFFAAFGHDGIGTIGTPTTINAGDMAGILMAAIKGLEKRTAELKEKEGKIAELEARLKTLERLMQDSSHVTSSTEPALNKVEGAVQ